MLFLLLALAGLQVSPPVEAKSVASGFNCVHDASDCMNAIVDIDRNSMIQTDSQDCGTAATRTWTGLGSTHNWSDAGNWSGSNVPDCNDHVVFNGTSSKNCLINVPIEVRNITTTVDFKGTIQLDSHRRVAAERVSLSGGGFAFRANSGIVNIGSLTIGNDVQLISGDSLLNIAGALVLAGDAVFTSRKGNIQCASINLGQGTSFTAPSGQLVVNGAFTKHKRADFHHANGTCVINGNANSTIDLSPGTLQVNGSCNFNRLVLNKPVNGSDNLTGVAGDTIHAHALVVRDGEWRGNAILAVRDSLIFEGSGDQGSQSPFWLVGSGNSQVVFADPQHGASASLIQVRKSSSSSEVFVQRRGSGNLQSNLAWDVVQGKLRFDGAYDVLQTKALTVQTNGSVLMPQGRVFELHNAALTIHGGFEARNGTFLFSGTQNRRVDFTGGPRYFHNLEINTAEPGSVDPGDLQTTGGNDTLIAGNRLTLLEAEFRGPSGSILVTEKDLVVRASMGDNTSAGFNHPVCIRGDGNSLYTAEAPWAGGALANLIIEKGSASNKVIVNKGNAAMSTILSGGQLFLNRGILEFDGTSDARIRSNDKPGIVVSQQAGIVAPDDDQLYLEGSWDFAGRFSPQQSTVVLEKISGDKMFQHNRALQLHHLYLKNSGGNMDPAYRWSWGAQPGSTSDTLWVKGNLTVERNGIRNVHVVVEGDYLNLDYWPGKVPVQLDQLIFKGNARQKFKTTQTLGANYELTDGVKVDKTSGHVEVEEVTNLHRVHFVRGYMDPAGKLSICGSEPVVGGNVSACFLNPLSNAQLVHVDSKDPRTNGAHQAWKNGQIEIPFGHPTYGYFPIRLMNKDKENYWSVMWIRDAATNWGGDTLVPSLDSIAGGFGAQTDEYGLWRVNRTTGSAKTQIAASAAKNPFDPSETVLAWKIENRSRNDDPWKNGGGTVSSFFLTGTGSYFDSGSPALFALALSRPKPGLLLPEEKPEFNGSDLESAGQAPNSALVASAGNLKFAAYPNPATGDLHFALEGSDKGVAELMDMQGKTLARWDLRQTRKVSMLPFAAGTYLLRYTDGNAVMSLRVQKM